MKIYTQIKKIIADTHTPVSIYLALRDSYQKAMLLESSDYQTKEGHYSYICAQPFAEISIRNNFLITKEGQNSLFEKIESKEKTLLSLEAFRQRFEFEDFNYKFCYAGLFGFTGYDAIPNFEDIQFQNNKSLNIPELYYAVCAFILVYDHNTDSLFIISHADSDAQSQKQLTEIEKKINHSKSISYPFSVNGEIKANLTDEEFWNLVVKAKGNCQAGDVFQLVLSKRFEQKFKGDEFNVYRALRNINPSPYLFYFDLGDYKLFGSSPEAQLVIQNKEAEIHPIAGTYKRTGNDTEDLKKACELLNDSKEQAEHMMLVDLSRNDLSKYCSDVKVHLLKQTQFYSHVIHLVSKVKGILKSNYSPFEVLMGTFPAGTLSGAPKYKAMELINAYEPCAREFYGGCIGFISNREVINQAIMIRTFISKDYTLYFQAGAGIVISSDPSNENQEINNKVNALKNAIQQAEKFNNITEEYSHEITCIR